MNIKTKEDQLKEYFFNDVLIRKLLNNLFASCFFIDFDFLLPYISQFDNIIVLPLLVLEIFWVYVFCIFSTLETIR